MKPVFSSFPSTNAGQPCNTPIQFYDDSPAWAMESLEKLTDEQIAKLDQILENAKEGK